MIKMFQDDHHNPFEPHPSGPGHHWWDNHRRGGLRIFVFSILQQAPRNGAEIMNEMELLSRGRWRPSPGSIYPLLDQLCKEESIKKREDGRYEITEKGRKEFEWPFGRQIRQPRSADSAVAEMVGYVSYLEDVKRMDPSKITASIEKLKNVRDRLTTLIDKN